MAFHLARQAVVQEHAQHGALGAGVGQLEARVLVIDHAAAEDLAVARVLRRFLQHAFQRGGRAQRDRQPFARQFTRQDLEGGVLRPQQAVRRHAHVIEVQLAGVLAVLPDLLQRRTLGVAG
ncbi:hypothetical protein D3C72_1420360 [compost metagenome]